MLFRSNEAVADHAIATLARLPDAPRVWAVGERVHALLVDAGLAPVGGFAVPTSVNAIPPLVGQILVDSQRAGRHDVDSQLHLIYNSPASGPTYETVSQQLLPLDEDWRRTRVEIPWPTKNLPEVMGGGAATLASLVGEYLFVSLFRACAESLASENASRLAAMERADKNIDELLGDLRGSFHRLRQNGIDEELFDVISGFEALNRPRQRATGKGAGGTTMKIKSDDFRVREGEKVELAKWKTLVTPGYRSKRQYAELLATHVEELSTLQKLHYASNRHALLLIFQAMDAAGKDGSIRHVMSGVNPQGCQVFSFKHPSATELEHDFLWRSTQCLPERGRIGIFNRSYYEEVLIVRVHPEILRSQGLPDALLDEKTVWKDRYRSIVDLEKHLYRNGTRILKFFLHLSKEEQRKRFLERIDDPTKNWKLSVADMEERGFWNEYMRAYEACLSATSTDIAPWYVVPADDKDNARLIVSQIVLETFRALEMHYPEVTPERRKDLLVIRDRLMAEDPAHH